MYNNFYVKTFLTIHTTCIELLLEYNTVTAEYSWSNKTRNSFGILPNTNLIENHSLGTI